MNCSENCSQFCFSCLTTIVLVPGFGAFGLGTVPPLSFVALCTQLNFMRINLLPRTRLFRGLLHTNSSLPQSLGHWQGLRFSRHIWSNSPNRVDVRPRSTTIFTLFHHQNLWDLCNMRWSAAHTFLHLTEHCGLITQFRKASTALSESATVTLDILATFVYVSSVAKWSSIFWSCQLCNNWASKRAIFLICSKYNVVSYLVGVMSVLCHKHGGNCLAWRTVLMLFNGPAKGQSKGGWTCCAVGTNFLFQWKSVGVCLHM